MKIFIIDNVYNICKFFKERFRGGSAEVSRVYDTFIVQGVRQKHFRGSVTQSFFQRNISWEVAGLWHIHFSKCKVKENLRVFQGFVTQSFFQRNISGVYHKLKNIFVRFRKGLTRVSRPPVWNCNFLALWKTRQYTIDFEF